MSSFFTDFVTENFIIIHFGNIYSETLGSVGKNIKFMKY